MIQKTIGCCIVQIDENRIQGGLPKESCVDPAAYLLMTNVPRNVWQALVFDHPQVVGRLVDCDIVIPPEYKQVSRQHAMVRGDQGGLWIKDLGSLGGTRLNGVPLLPQVKTRAVVGDRMSLGGLELYFVSPKASILDESDAAAQERIEKSRTVNFLTGPAQKSNEIVSLDRISPAELEVIRWACRGLTTVEEIGQKLYRSPHTVRTQLGSIYKKLGVHSRDELLALLRRSEIAWTQPEIFVEVDLPIKTNPPSESQNIPESSDR
ncbi:MAG: FHA domain-containing protein [Planctomycetota bacterium]|nr:MAG: FHA domain-containing protein [Planctomycetota bacterium]